MDQYSMIVACRDVTVVISVLLPAAAPLNKLAKLVPSIAEGTLPPAHSISVAAISLCDVTSLINVSLCIPGPFNNKGTRVLPS